MILIFLVASTASAKALLSAPNVIIRAPQSTATNELVSVKVVWGAPRIDGGFIVAIDKFPTFYRAKTHYTKNQKIYLMLRPGRKVFLKVYGWRDGGMITQESKVHVIDISIDPNAPPPEAADINASPAPSTYTVESVDEDGIETIVFGDPEDVEDAEFFDDFVEDEDFGATDDTEDNEDVDEIVEELPVIEDPPSEWEKQQRKIASTNQSIYKAMNERRRYFEVSAGSGMNVVNLSQNVSGLADTSFSSFKGPSSYLRLSVFPWKYLKVHADYKLTPGAVTTDTQELEYEWSVMSASLQARLTPNNYRHFFSLVAGAHQHSFPFLGVEQSDQFVLSTHNLQSASFGIHYNYYINDRWRFIYSQNMHVALSSSLSTGEELDITPTQMFDGSLAFRYYHTPGFWSGFYWYGQSHGFAYESGTLDNGEQELFFSNIELRIGLPF